MEENKKVEEMESEGFQKEDILNESVTDDSDDDEDTFDESFVDDDNDDDYEEEESSEEDAEELFRQNPLRAIFVRLGELIDGK